MHLKPGEIICPECNGTGDSQAYNPCSKCYGDGKLDWVENVVGKKVEPLIDSSTVWLTSIPPKNPVKGSMYMKEDNFETYIYDGSDWILLDTMTTR